MKIPLAMSSLLLATAIIGTTSPAFAAVHIIDTNGVGTSTPSISELSDFERTQITNYAVKAASDLAAVSDRQEDLIIRIDSRARKFQQDGFNVSLIKAIITEAKANLEISRTKTRAIIENVIAVAGFGNFTQVIQEARLSLAEAKASVETTRQKIGDSIDALLNLSDQSTAASTTPSNR
jgi:hypothetical protein